MNRAGAYRSNRQDDGASDASPVAFLRELALALRDQPRGGGFDIVLQPLRRSFLVEAGRDRVEHFDPHGARDSGGTSGAARTGRN